jgi:hypothetical protein
MIPFGASVRNCNLKAQRKMTTIYKTALGAAALVVALGFAAFSPSHDDHITARIITGSAAAAPAPVTIWEIHNLAHLESLPIQDVEDQSLVFHQAKR